MWQVNHSLFSLLVLLFWRIHSPIVKNTENRWSSDLQKHMVWWQSMALKSHRTELSGTNDLWSQTWFPIYRIGIKFLLMWLLHRVKLNIVCRLSIMVRSGCIVNVSSPLWREIWVFSNDLIKLESLQFSSVARSCPTLCDPMNRRTPGLPVHCQLLEFTQTHVLQVSDAIQPSHPLSSPSPPAPNRSQHQRLFQWVNSLHEVAKVLEFQLQHQSFQWTPRTDLL